MICKRCGAINDNQNVRCSNCHTLLQESSTTVQYSHKVIQSPLKQAQPSNIITANAPSYSQQANSEGQTMNHQTTRDQSSPNTHKAAADREHHYQPQTQDETQSKVSGGLKRKTILLTLIACSALFASVAALYLYLSPRGTDANFLFAEAEKKFSSQNYATALVMYRQFVEKFPEDHLVALAKERIEMITNHFAFEKEMKEQKIEELLEKAKEAFRRQRYLRPKQDNVVFYTSRVLELVPTNASAIELQALVIRYYETKAQDAEKRGYSKTAITHYKNILEVLPNDATVLAKIDSLQSLKKLK